MFTRGYGKEKVEEIFWDEVADGRSYDGAMEAASNWAANNPIEGVDYDDEDVVQLFDCYLYSGIPSYQEFLRMKKPGMGKRNRREEPPFPYTKESYDAALERWHANGFKEPMSYYDFIEFMTEYLD